MGNSVDLGQFEHFGELYKSITQDDWQRLKSNHKVHETMIWRWDQGDTPSRKQVIRMAAGLGVVDWLDLWAMVAEFYGIPNPSEDEEVFADLLDRFEIKDLAATAGVSRATLHAWKNGRARPSSEMIARVSAAMDISAARVRAALKR